MPRIPVPDDYEGDAVTVAGSEDYHYGEADVNLDSQPRARNLQIREDEDGRYCGAGGDVAEAVADYLGVTLSAASDPQGSDGEETCQTVKTDGEVCGRELPCPYHSEGEE